MLNYIHIYICIITSILYIITALITNQRERLLYVLVPIMIISYIIGLIVRFYLGKKVFDQDLQSDVNGDVSLGEEGTNDESEEEATLDDLDE